MTKPNNSSSNIEEAHQGPWGKGSAAPLEGGGLPDKSRLSFAPERGCAELLPNTRSRDSAGTGVRECRATVVLSDMAPSFSGDHDMDQARVAGLVLDALAACLGDESRRTKTLEQAESGPSRDDVEHSRDVKDGRLFSAADEHTGIQEVAGKGTGPGGSGASIGLLARGGAFLGKFFAGRDEREVKEEAERLFRSVKVVKPPASRSGSSEMYILATGFLLGKKKR